MKSNLGFVKVVVSLCCNSFAALWQRIFCVKIAKMVGATIANFFVVQFLLFLWILWTIGTFLFPLRCLQVLNSPFSNDWICKEIIAELGFLILWVSCLLFNFRLCSFDPVDWSKHHIIYALSYLGNLKKLKQAKHDWLVTFALHSIFFNVTFLKNSSMKCPNHFCADHDIGALFHFPHMNNIAFICSFCYVLPTDSHVRMWLMFSSCML